MWTTDNGRKVIFFSIWERTNHTRNIMFKMHNAGSIQWCCKHTEEDNNLYMQEHMITAWYRITYHRLGPGIPLAHSMGWLWFIAIQWKGSQNVIDWETSARTQVSQYNCYFSVYIHAPFQQSLLSATPSFQGNVEKQMLSFSAVDFSHWMTGSPQASFRTLL